MIPGFIFRGLKGASVFHLHMLSGFSEKSGEPSGTVALERLGKTKTEIEVHTEDIRLQLVVGRRPGGCRSDGND